MKKAGILEKILKGNNSPICLPLNEICEVLQILDLMDELYQIDIQKLVSSDTEL